jgi:hypothetical protein
MLVAKSPDYLGTDDVDLAVEKAPAFREFPLLGGQAVGQIAQLFIAVRLDVDQTFERSVVHFVHTLTIEVPLGTFNLRLR